MQYVAIRRAKDCLAFVTAMEQLLGYRPHVATYLAFSSELQPSYSWVSIQDEGLELAWAAIELLKAGCEVTLEGMLAMLNERREEIPDLITWR